MAYEIWDTITGNLLRTHETEDAAQAVSRRALAEHGPDYVASLLLGHEDTRGRSRLIASEQRLIDRVHHSESSLTVLASREPRAAATR